MKESIVTILKEFKTSIIHISAQTYLEKFYNTHGFQQTGEGYLEDGIPHIKMIMN
jgi:ElaA protein